MAERGLTVPDWANPEAHHREIDMQRRAHFLYALIWPGSLFPSAALSEEMPVDGTIRYILEESFSAESSCSSDFFKKLQDKYQLTMEQCHDRMKVFREQCPKKIAKNFPKSIPEERLREIFDAIFNCQLSVVYAAPDKRESK